MGGVVIFISADLCQFTNLCDMGITHKNALISRFIWGRCFVDRRRSGCVELRVQLIISLHSSFSFHHHPANNSSALSGSQSVCLLFENDFHFLLLNYLVRHLHSHSLFCPSNQAPLHHRFNISFLSLLFGFLKVTQKDIPALRLAQMCICVNIQISLLLHPRRSHIQDKCRGKLE